MKRHPASIMLSLLVVPLAIGCAQTVEEEVGRLEAAVKSAKSSEEEGGGAPPKVVICHIPPGNPANAHTIEVGASAVSAHLAHGDVLGACPGEGAGGQGGHCPNGVSSSSSGTGVGGDIIMGPQR